MLLTAFKTAAEETLILDPTAPVIRLAINLEMNRC